MRWRLLVITALAALVPTAAHADAGECNPLDCAPFRCTDAGCKMTCEVDSDCADGLKCDTAHDRCVKPDPDAVNTGNLGSCAFGHSTTAPFLFALFMLGLLRRR